MCSNIHTHLKLLLYLWSGPQSSVRNSIMFFIEKNHMGWNHNLLLYYISPITKHIQLPLQWVGTPFHNIWRTVDICRLPNKHFTLREMNLCLLSQEPNNFSSKLIHGFIVWSHFGYQLCCVTFPVKTWINVDLSQCFHQSLAC